MSLTEGIREALAVERREDSATQVQELVAKELEKLTAGTTVRRTGYFNHSWAPDLVVERRGGQPERRVFLRFDVHDTSFLGDLEGLARVDPFFFDLVAGNPEAVPAPETERIDLDEAIRQYEAEDILVSELPAVERLNASVGEDTTVREATRQVVVGGRGVVDSEAADRIAGSWRRATTAIATSEREELRGALNEIEVFLSEVTALDFESTVRSKWVAAGGAAETFPGREDWNLQQREPWEIARLVLALVDDYESVEAAQWEEIARSISLSELGHELFRLGQYREGGGVNALMRAALPYWTAKYAYAPPGEAETLLERFNWSIGTYSVGINLSKCQAFFTDIGVKWNRVPRPGAMPSVRGFLDRVGDARIVSARVQTSEEEMAVSLRPTATKSLKDLLEAHVGAQGDDAAWRQARVVAADIQVPGTNAVANIDFKRSVIGSENSVPIRSFVELVARFVAFLGDEEVAALMARLDGEGGQANEIAGGGEEE